MKILIYSVLMSYFIYQNFYQDGDNSEYEAELENYKERKKKSLKIPATCDLCNKTLASQKGLYYHKKYYHIKEEDKRYICHICDKRFAHAQFLKKHIETHSDEKKNSCNICDKKFKDKGSLYYHNQLHNTDLPHVCGVCGSGFTQKSAL